MSDKKYTFMHECANSSQLREDMYNFLYMFNDIHLDKELGLLRSCTLYMSGNVETITHYQEQHPSNSKLH